jgi:hypothetical protein
MELNINNNNIDDEWDNFIANKYDNDTTDDENNSVHDKLNTNELNSNLETFKNCNVPIPTDIYISTKSKIAYLVQPVDLNIFWDIPVMPYATPQNGVIKKQIKINSKTPEELEVVQQRLQKELYFDEYIMSHIDNPNGRIKFKDIRKITIGVSKKDIMSYRSKKKQAFYNCFVMILRIKIDNLFREFHIKVFNTGKLEIPGVQSDVMFETVLIHIINILQPFYLTTLTYFEKRYTVLINSNFNCGFYINREVLFNIIKNKYNIQAIYDPCSYPGIQCKFYYNNDIGIQTGMQITSENKNKYTNITEVSFMIFRTGSVLIVGMCDENVLLDIYQFLKALLKTEFENICQKIISPSDLANKKIKKIRKKTINIITGVPVPTETSLIVTNEEITHVEQVILEQVILEKIQKKRKTKTNAQLEIIDEH